MQASIELSEIQEEISRESGLIDQLMSETQRVIVGQERMIERLLIGLLAKGHILLEGLPGLAKTLAIKTLAQSIDAQFHRIQFTPDLLPADVIGTMVYNPASAQFSVRKGPIFANFILADEINRAPAKVQSALLEAMQERQVTIGDKSYPLEDPFLVLATQNPLEQEGTYPLPEAQLDRFLLKVKISYPTRAEELEIMRRNLGTDFPAARPVITTAAIVRARTIVERIYMDEKIEQYILDLVIATRQPAEFGQGGLAPLMAYGGSPRASVAIAKSARALAFIRRRAFVIPEDVRSVAHEALRHRIGITYEAEAEGIEQDEIINRILAAVPVP
jgi:MoxR-like ATPase